MDRKISYIDKVIRDSFCAEQRDVFNASFQYVQVTDKTAILIVKVPYQRVLRRIVYRLEHNFTKNFNIELDVYSPLNRRIYLCTNYHIYENQISRISAEPDVTLMVSLIQYQHLAMLYPMISSPWHISILWRSTGTITLKVILGWLMSISKAAYGE